MITCGDCPATAASRSVTPLALVMSISAGMVTTTCRPDQVTPDSGAVAVSAAGGVGPAAAWLPGLAGLPAQDEQGDIVGVRAVAGHGCYHRGAAGLGPGGGDGGAKPGDPVVDGLVAALDQPIGVQAQHRAGREVQDGDAAGLQRGHADEQAGGRRPAWRARRGGR